MTTFWHDLRSRTATNNGGASAAAVVRKILKYDDYEHRFIFAPIVVKQTEFLFRIL